MSSALSTNSSHPYHPVSPPYMHPLLTTPSPHPHLPLSHILPVGIISHGFCQLLLPDPPVLLVLIAVFSVSHWECPAPLMAVTVFQIWIGKRRNRESVCRSPSEARRETGASDFTAHKAFSSFSLHVGDSQTWASRTYSSYEHTLLTTSPPSFPASSVLNIIEIFFLLISLNFIIGHITFINCTHPIRFITQNVPD